MVGRSKLALVIHALMRCEFMVCAFVGLGWSVEHTLARDRCDVLIFYALVEISWLAKILVPE